MLKSILIYFFGFLIHVIHGQESPCPNLFRYEYENNQWNGVIRIPTGQFGGYIHLRLELSIGASLPTSYVGRIELADSNAVVKTIVRRGGILTYKVYFPISNSVPKLTAIIINNNLYCSGPPEVPSINTPAITEIKLNHELSLNKNVQADSYYPQVIPSQPPVIPEKTQTSYYQTRPPFYEVQTQPPAVQYTTKPQFDFIEPTTEQAVQYPPPSNENEVCGTTEIIISNKLITKGEKAERGEWPWVVAIFTLERGKSSFICSGTLISSKHIVTAAHCIDKEKSRIVKLGVKTIENWNDQNQKTLKPLREVVHPDFNSETLHNDIAMMKINTVEFTKYIKPICMSQNNVNVYGIKATVVGWGKDENGIQSPDLRKAFATIVSNEECLRGDFRIATFISEKTLCAGERDGTGPCNGDSGGGLFIKNNGRWHIKGIVSNSLPDLATNAVCGNKEYVVYTYTDSYIDWIYGAQQQL